MSKPLGLILARGGSKRFPGKHLADLGGKPLLAWTIEAARESGIFDRILVSSDGPAIREAATRCGADVHARCAAWAADDVTMCQAAQAVCGEIGHAGPVYLLPPTSPFRSALSIRTAWQRFEFSEASILISATWLEVPAEWLLEPTEWGTGLQPRDPESFGLPRQRAAVHRAWLRPEGGHLIGRTPVALAAPWPTPFAFVLPPREEQVDIDTPADLEYARWLLSRPRSR